MLYFGCIFLVMATFWAYISFKDARWVADEEGPSVWDYAFPGIAMFFFCGTAGLACLVAHYF